MTALESLTTVSFPAVTPRNRPEQLLAHLAELRQGEGVGALFLVLAHDRRRILHFVVTAHPTAERTAQQLRKAFPWDCAPPDLLRDRDQIFGKVFVGQVKALGIKQVLSAPRSPWQRAYVERLIGSIRQPPAEGAVMELREVGGLHHHYERRAA